MPNVPDHAFFTRPLSKWSSSLTDLPPHCFPKYTAKVSRHSKLNFAVVSTFHSVKEGCGLDLEVAAEYDFWVRFLAECRRIRWLLGEVGFCPSGDLTQTCVKEDSFVQCAGNRPGLNLDAYQSSKVTQRASLVPPKALLTVLPLHQFHAAWTCTPVG